METDYIDGRKPLASTENLIKEADKIDLLRSMMFGVGGNSIHSGQEEEFLESAAKEIRLRCQAMEQQSPLIGQVLSEVKRRLPHGSFGKWIEDNCPFDEGTAENLMKLYRVTLAHPALAKMKKSVLYHIGSASFPEKLREILADSAVGVYDFSMKEILTLQTKFINNELTEDSEEFKSFLQNQHQVNVLERWKLEWKGSIAALEKHKAKYQRLLARQKEVAGEQLKNEYTEYWKSSINILSDAIYQFSRLYEGCEAKPTSFATEEVDHNTEECAEPVAVVQQPPDRHRGIPMLGLSAQEVSKLETAEIHRLKYYAEILGPDDLIPIYDDVSDEELVALYEREILRELAPDDLIVPVDKSPDSTCDFDSSVSERQVLCCAAGYVEQKMKLLPAPAADNHALGVVSLPTGRNVDIAAMDIGLSVEDLAAMTFKEPSYYVHPILREQTLSTVYANAGVGKTWFGHSIAAGLTRENPEGTTIGPWKITKGCGVLLVDGELPLPDILHRLQLLTKPMGKEGKDTPLRIWSSVHNEAENGRYINLIEKEWRDRISRHFVENPKYKLLILDNLSSLTSGKGQDSKLGWEQVNLWLLKLRSMGVSVILFNHENKDGSDRGNSCKRDNLDTVIALKHNRTESVDTVSMVVKFEKGRQLKPGEGAEVKLKLKGNEETGLWFELTD